LDLSQKSLGRLLGLDYQTILGWEKNKKPISKTADNFLRIIFLSYLNEDTLYEKINEIADLDASNEINRIELKEINKEWRIAA
jgi:transcriptional regulator with XRE-family HTH domain